MPQVLVSVLVSVMAMQAPVGMRFDNIVMAITCCAESEKSGSRRPTEHTKRRSKFPQPSKKIAKKKGKRGRLESAVEGVAFG